MTAWSARMQFFSFAVIGGLAFVVDAAVLQALISWVSMDARIARLVSIMTAMTFTWLVNRNTTFRHQRSQSLGSEYLRFVGVNSVGAVINYICFAIALKLLPAAVWAPVVSVAIGSIGGLGWNFTMSRKLVFAGARTRQ